MCHMLCNWAATQLASLVIVWDFHNLKAGIPGRDERTPQAENQICYSVVHGFIRQPVLCYLLQASMLKHASIVICSHAWS